MKSLLLLLGATLSFAGLSGNSLQENNQSVENGGQESFKSVEIGISELSPAGEAGGYAIPASGTSNTYLCSSLFYPSTGGAAIASVTASSPYNPMLRTSVANPTAYKITGFSITRNGTTIATNPAGWNSANPVDFIDTTVKTLTPGTYDYHVNVSYEDASYCWDCSPNTYNVTCMLPLEVQTPPTTPPSGSISASNCSISSGASSCDTSVSWSVSNPVSPSVRQSGTQFSTAPSSGGTSRTVNYGSTSFTLYDGPSFLASKTVDASCVGGTHWSSGKCAPDGAKTGTLTVPDCTIAVGASTCTSHLSWTTSGVISASVRDVPTGQFSTLLNGDAFRQVAHGGSYFSIYDGPAFGGTYIIGKVGYGYCESGSVWNGSICLSTTPSGACLISPLVIPAGKTSATFKVWGAGGIPDFTYGGGGRGGYAEGTFSVTPGQTFTINTGVPAGPSPSGVFLGPMTQANAYVVAGSGAAGAYMGSGGAGGGTNGLPGDGQGGTQTSGGAGGAVFEDCYIDTFIMGLTGGALTGGAGDGGGTDGGAGYWGGGGGGGGNDNCAGMVAGGGGGGSGYVKNTATDPKNITAAGSSAGQLGCVIVEYNDMSKPDLLAFPPTLSTTTVAVGDTIDFTGVIKNLGTKDAGPYNIAYFSIDSDGVFPPGEASTTATDITTNTPVGGSNTTTGSWAVPLTATPGTTYHVGYFADVGNVVDEGVGDGPLANWSGWSVQFEVVPATVSLTNVTPDLNPLTVTGSLTQGQNVTFKGRVRNTGNQIINTAFSDNFTYCWGVACAPGTMIGGHISEIPAKGASLAANGTFDDNSALFNLANAGTLRIQHCVDSTGAINELPNSPGETDNCIVTDFNVSAAAVPTGWIKANGVDNATSITLGDPVAITWGSGGGATGCSIDPTRWTGLSGTQTDGSLSADRLYTLICNPGSVPVDSVDVTVNPAATAPTLTANPAVVIAGQTTQLSWDTNNNGNETDCTLTGSGIPAGTLSNGTGDGDTGSVTTPTINAQTTYTLTCPLFDSVSVTVKVVPKTIEI